MLPQATSAASAANPASVISEERVQQCCANLDAFRDQLIDVVRRAVQEHTPVHEVELSGFRLVLKELHCLLDLFFKLLGPGDVGEQVTLDDGRVLRRLENLHARPYLSIVGGFRLQRCVYGTREGQAHEFVPLDERLGLPAGKFSYLLQDWDQSAVMEQPFSEVSSLLQRILGLRQHVDSLEHVNRQMAEQVEPFHAAQQPPADDGPLLLQSVDHKGVPLRHEADRTTITDHDPEAPPRKNRKRMAALATVYSVERYVRTPEQILEALFRKPGTPRDPAEPKRPRPQHKRVRACLSHEDADGNAIDGTAAMFGWLADETKARNPEGKRTLIHITDGEEQLRTERDVFQKDVPMQDILDLLHVTPRVWTAAKLFYSDEASREPFVRDRTLRILRGETASVVLGLQQMGGRHKLEGKDAEQLATICAFFEKNAYRMQYARYLAWGYPIASGVIEGACRNVVSDRMERTGMSWILEGAQPMLSLRSIWLSEDWDEYQQFRIEREMLRLHPHRSYVKQLSWAQAI